MGHCGRLLGLVGIIASVALVGCAGCEEDDTAPPGGGGTSAGGGTSSTTATGVGGGGAAGGGSALSELCFERVHVEPPNGGGQQTASLIVDIDGDGTSDFVIAERTQAPSVVWYRRVADGWDAYPIDDGQRRVEAGGAVADIDGDGDQDIVFGGDSGSSEVWWWENPAPSFDAGQAWTRRLIKNSGATKHHDELFGDFDDDGEVELVYWNQNASALFLADIPADPLNTEPWPAVEIYSWSSGAEHEGLSAADVDGNGIVDIVGGGRWFERTGGTSYTAHVIDDSQRFTRAAAGQLVPGGYAEVVFVAGDAAGPLRWYEHDGSDWVAQDLLAEDVDHGHSLFLEDVDQDGNLDIFVAEMRLNGANEGSQMTVLFGDGQGSFTPEVIAGSYGNHESRVGDLDGDGDIDILGKPYNWEAPRLDVWLNCTGDRLSLDRWQRHVIDDARPAQAVFVTAGDLDGDSALDVITGGWWYRNPGTLGDAWTRSDIGSPLNNMAAVHDFDGDGDLDVLGTEGQGSTANADFVFAEGDGSGSFTIATSAATGDGDFLQGVCVGNAGSGSELSVFLSWHQAGRGIQRLTVPANPGSDSWPWEQIDSSSQDEQLSCGDIDDDGDLDLLLGTQWLQNDGSSWSMQTVSSVGGSPDRNRLADVDGDGRLDAVVGFEAISVAGTLAWYQQPSSLGSDWAETVIADDVIGPMSVDVADLDDDGDVDVVVGEHNLANPDEAALWVFENVDGAGSSWRRHWVYTGDEHHDGAQLADLDGDGDLDIVSIGWGHDRVVIYENLLR
ncbi:MAG: VCBS repeat-containing protein [Deltaproteobacteria bacterium]|jgi:hypothetical protein|nr:VCBS repeat-containing protein [Deltaproteobacteria bacterium]MBW2536162.1 VCBS repeat-containing protein [Deltaproteobacteria bacterium]